MSSESVVGAPLAEVQRLVHLVVAARRAAVARLRRGAGVVRAHLLFRRADVGWRVNAAGRVRVAGGGHIAIGDHVDFAGGMIPSEVLCRPGAELLIGAHSAFNYGTVIDCSHSIRIGEHCLFGSMTRVRDATPRKSGPVVVEDHVWVAHGVVIEPGVRIGAGSVVSAGSVVTTDVPPESLAIGDPAESFPLGERDDVPGRDAW
jgi:maltose O-acetyltransferase